MFSLCLNTNEGSDFCAWWRGHPLFTPLLAIYVDVDLAFGADDWDIPTSLYKGRYHIVKGLTGSAPLDLY